MGVTDRIRTSVHAPSPAKVRGATEFPPLPGVPHTVCCCSPSTGLFLSASNPEAMNATLCSTNNSSCAAATCTHVLQVCCRRSICSPHPPPLQTLSHSITCTAPCFNSFPSCWPITGLLPYSERPHLHCPHVDTAVSPPDSQDVAALAAKRDLSDWTFNLVTTEMLESLGWNVNTCLTIKRQTLKNTHTETSFKVFCEAHLPPCVIVLVSCFNIL